jgi:hypothetical protein
LGLEGTPYEKERVKEKKKERERKKEREKEGERKRRRRKIGKARRKPERDFPEGVSRAGFGLGGLGV